MAGASLMPDFYKQKVNLAVFLAPPASLKYNGMPLMEIAAIKINRDLIVSVLDTIKLWDILPYDYVQSGVASTFCNLFDGKICDLMMSFFTDADPSIDNMERRDMYMSNMPAGAGYKCTLHYA